MRKITRRRFVSSLAGLGASLPLIGKDGAQIQPNSVLLNSWENRLLADPQPPRKAVDALATWFDRNAPRFQSLRGHAAPTEEGLALHHLRRFNDGR